MTVATLIMRAREERCLLRDYWERGAGLRGREQVKLAKALLEIKPPSHRSNGYWVPVSEPFQLRPKDRRRIVEELLLDGEDPHRLHLLLGGIEVSESTLRRIVAEHCKTGLRRRLNKPSSAPKLARPVHRRRCAYLDATSGANLEAEIAFRRLIGGAIG